MQSGECFIDDAKYIATIAFLPVLSVTNEKNYHVHVFLDLLKLVKQKCHWIIKEKFIFFKDR